jgi:carbonic anhydrase
MRRVTAFDDVLAANADYAADFESTGRPGQAARGLAVVTCMDSRIDPLGMLGLAKGDAKILRNAGGRVTDDVLRTLVLATYLLGVNRVMVVEHTDCGMTKRTDDEVHQFILETAGVDTRSLEFRTMSDQEACVRLDVQRIRSSPFLPKEFEVAGFIYDVQTGRLQPVD